MRRVPTDEVKDRTKRVSAIFQSYFPYEHKMGQRQRVLITEVAKDGVHFVGHNKTYDQVLVKGESDLMGKMVEVEIYETGKHFMKAKLLDNSEIINPGLKSPLMKGEVSGVPDKKIIKTLEEPLPQSLWTTILHIGLFVLLMAIAVDVCLLFHEIRRKHFSWG